MTSVLKRISGIIEGGSEISPSAAAHLAETILWAIMKPTAGMRLAGYRTHDCDYGLDKNAAIFNRDNAEHIYKAMITAALAGK